MRGIICIAGTNAWHFLGCSFSQCPLSEPYHQPCSSELHGQHQVPGFGGGGRHRFQCRARRGFAGRRDSTRRICQISFQITHHCQGMKCNVISAFLNCNLCFFTLHFMFLDNGRKYLRALNVASVLSNAAKYSTSNL